MLVWLIKTVYVFAYRADIYALFIHVFGFLCNVQAYGACYAVLVERAIIAPETVARMQVALVLASTIARDLLKKRPALRSLCPFIYSADFTCHIRRNFIGIFGGEEEITNNSRENKNYCYTNQLSGVAFLLSPFHSNHSMTKNRNITARLPTALCHAYLSL